MSQDSITTAPSRSDVSSMTLQETELTLGLPGSPPVVVTGGKICHKRGFIDTVDLNLGSCLSNPSHDARTTAKCPVTKAQVVGWPPVRSSRKKSLEMSKLVKVAVDGAPYLRKVDLHMHTSYQQLFRALEQIFTCFTIHGNNMKERKIMGPMKGMEYVPTYEDKEDDWMLVGDVPWNKKKSDTLLKLK
ncbi:hypothetical protein Q3G72_014648 [Acer saccharum]|nr:hypothetical protein Q3G72_014648 [Acer saccharum]